MYNLGHNILRLFDILPNFLLPQVKRIVIISNNHGIYIRVALGVAEQLKASKT